MDSWGSLSADWSEIEEVIVYGFGSTAEVYIDNLMKDVRICFIIDNGGHKPKKYKDIEIGTYKEKKIEIGNRKIVILAETLMYNQISNELIKEGYVENVDFTGIERFICEWYYRHHHKVCIMEMHTAITTRCTFNCRNCNMFMPYYKEKKDYCFEELATNLDMLFQHVDYVFKYQLLGGEPFLNKDLSKFLNYIAEHYQDKIGRIRLITNGSIVPSAELIQAIKVCGAEVNVSNYLDAVPYDMKYQQVISVLKQNDIFYKENKTLKWRDFGFPKDYQKREGREENRKHMFLCGTAWHGLIDGRLYYCNSSWSAEKCGLFTCSEDDYIDLRKLGKEEVDRQLLLNLCLGNMKSGYNSFCSVCGGCGEDNKNMVSVGVQA